MQGTFRNASNERRVWPNISIPTTKQTLELGPGETAFLEVPDNFSDFALELVTPHVSAPAPVLVAPIPLVSRPPNDTPSETNTTEAS